MLRKTTYLFLTLLAVVCARFCAKAQMNQAENGVIYSTDEVSSLSDTTALFTIKSIVIEGNRKTDERIILRELSFGEHEQYPLNVLVEKFYKAKKQLMNSGLFMDVVVSLKSLQGYDASVLVAVKERWYIYPIPFARVVDRSLQEWVKNQNMDLTRVNYGLKLKHKNFTGKNDKLYLNLTNGYTKEVTVRYEDWPIDRKLRWFATSSISFGKNRELNYGTFGNQVASYKNPDQFVRSYLHTSFEISHRPAIKTKHTFGVSYFRERLHDTIHKLAPLFTFQKDRISYPLFFYRMQYFDVDFIPYPKKGYAADVNLVKKGLNNNVNLWQLTARTMGSWPLNDKYFFNLRLGGTVKLPFTQPYIMQQMMGYNDMYLQGYEDYIIDGVAGGYTKATFARELINTHFNVPFTNIKRAQHVPLRVYGKVYGNAGYVYHPQPGTSTLNNKLLYSGGVGLDIILLYDFVIKLEWSFNHLRQNGIYLHDRRYL